MTPDEFWATVHGFFVPRSWLKKTRELTVKNPIHPFQKGWTSTSLIFLYYGDLKLIPVNAYNSGTLILKHSLAMQIFIDPLLAYVDLNPILAGIL